MRKLQSIFFAPIVLLALLVGTNAWAGATPQVLNAGTDFNGDGVADIFSIGASATRVELISSVTGSTRLSTGGTTVGIGYVSTQGGSWTLVAVGDCDGDGFADLVHTKGNLLRITFMEGQFDNGNVTYVPINGWSLGAIGDVNGDGAADLVFNPASVSFIRIVYGIDQTGASSSAYIGNGVGAYSAALVADIDGAGGSVGIVANPTGASGVIRVSQMTGTTLSGTLYIGDGGGAYSAAFAGQADGLNGQDLYLRSGSATKIVLMNSGGEISASYQADGAYPLDLIADTNGDGKIDLVGDNQADGSFRVVLVDGTPTGSRGYNDLPNTNSFISQVGDTNADGDVDVIYVDDTADAFRFYLMSGTTGTDTGALGNGGGTYASPLGTDLIQY